MKDLNQIWVKRRQEVHRAINIPDWRETQALRDVGLVEIKFTIDPCIQPRILAVDYLGAEDTVSVSYRDDEPRGFFGIGDYVIDVSLDPIVLDLWEKSLEFFTSPYAEDLNLSYLYQPLHKTELV